MPDYILLMHADGRVPPEPGAHDWGAYLAALGKSGGFHGGSAIGAGICVRKSGDAPPLTNHLLGYLRITADNLVEARKLLKGNPVFEAGGTVEIRELPRAD